MGTRRRGGRSDVIDPNVVFQVPMARRCSLPVAFGENPTANTQLWCLTGPSRRPPVETDQTQTVSPSDRVTIFRPIRRDVNCILLARLCVTVVCLTLILHGHKVKHPTTHSSSYNYTATLKTVLPAFIGVPTSLPSSTYSPTQIFPSCRCS